MVLVLVQLGAQQADGILLQWQQWLLEQQQIVHHLHHLPPLLLLLPKIHPARQVYHVVHHPILNHHLHFGSQHN